MSEEKRKNSPEIIEQGFRCDANEYYLLGMDDKRSVEITPKVAIKNDHSYFCAYVTRLDKTTISRKYFKPGHVPDMVLEYMKTHNFKTI